MEKACSINTCIVIVTYNPLMDFFTHIEYYLEIVNEVIIVDNNSSFNIAKYIPQNSCDHIKIICSPVNNGIAWGLNQGIQYAILSKYLYVLTLDQDSIPVINILDLYSTILNSYSKIGLIGTTYTNEICNVNAISVKPKLTIITSGTLHPISIFKEIGMYDESLFIDSVDFDFTLRVKDGGYKVLRVKEPLLSHTLGNPMIKYGITSSNHNAVRRYFMARNHVVMIKRYCSKHPCWILKKNLYFIYSLFCMLIVEHGRKNKIKQIIKGIYDGFKMQ